MARAIALRHVSSPACAGDGVRVLVERRWPPGLRREQVAPDLWLQDLAPSQALARWYGRDPRRWAAFAQRYRAELLERRDLVLVLQELWARGPITLVHCGRDPERAAASVLREMLEERVLAARMPPARGAFP